MGGGREKRQTTCDGPGVSCDVHAYLILGGTKEKRGLTIMQLPLHPTVM